MSALWSLLFVSLVMWLAYQRASFVQATVVLGVLLASYTVFGAGPIWWRATLWVLFTPLLLLNVLPWRRSLISRRFLRIYKRMLPHMSTTEREALEAGTVWWDGELFTGGPDWNKLLSAKAPKLTVEEQAFIDGPCEELCRMLDDWDITHRRADLPPNVFDFIKKKGFWAMIIPKKYGGLEFSAYAHSTVVVKIAGRSATAASTVVVPNSLGPAELLLHYGTEDQKSHYLPRLARGEEIPCFGLTGPRAGS
ncbi:MAG: acyl-CoA dehydrogenase family protein, partial [Steroidobacteraceae bacterium]